MRIHLASCILGIVVIALFRAPPTHAALAAGCYYEVSYEPSSAQGELQLGVTYKVWIPNDVATLRGVIVHQHGCGSGACQGGQTAAHDLHWQALAARWDCACWALPTIRRMARIAGYGATRATARTRRFSGHSANWLRSRNTPSSSRCPGAYGDIRVALSGRA